jgi:hypothetical protein
MIKTIFWGITNAYSGGLIYNSIYEIMNYGDRTITFRDTPFEMHNYLNWGFILGLSIGIYRGIGGKPAIAFSILDPKK